MDCAAYEPTGDLRKIARELVVGDKVEVYGAVRKATAGKPLTINLGKNQHPKPYTKKHKWKILFAPTVANDLKSMGKNQGFRCEKCGGKYGDLKKQESVSFTGA